MLESAGGSDEDVSSFSDVEAIFRALSCRGSSKASRAETKGAVTPPNSLPMPSRKTNVLVFEFPPGEVAKDGFALLSMEVHLAFSC